MSGNKRRRAIVPQGRDLRLLRELSVMRVIDRAQAQLIAGFGTQQGASFRMLGLTEAGLVLRYNIGTAAGGQKALYLLSAIGAKAVGVPNRSPRRKSGMTVAVDIFARHQLAVNDIHCALKYKDIPVEGVRFLRWVSFFDSVVPGIALIPDGYAEMETNAGIVASFLEVDFDTEGLTVWRTKIRNYLTLALSGEFEKRFHQSRFRVLVIANSERRMQSIRKLAATMTNKIFWLSTLDALRKDFWAPVWLRPRENELRPFV